MAAKGSPSFQISAKPVTIFAHFVALALITLVLVWLFQFREGIALESDLKQKIFNVHPLLMALGFILFAGQANMAFKTVPGTRKTQTLVHAFLHSIALLAGIVGIYAVFKFHDELGIPHMHTLHSWIGMSTICLFGIQWQLAVFTSMLPGAEMGKKSKISPWNIFFGIINFFMAILSAEIGLAERLFSLSLGKSREALIVSFTGLLLLLFAISVGLSHLLPRLLT